MRRSQPSSTGWMLAAAGVVTAVWLIGRRRKAFVGKLALVTGGSRGLGLNLARELGSRGATVVICARKEEELEQAAHDLAHAGVDVYTHACDVTDREAVARMIEDVELEHGPIDVLVNNAGILHVGPATAMTVEDIHAAMDTNFWGAVHGVDAVLPGMLARHAGQIVNIASIGGIAPVPWMLPYSASKSALMGYSVALHHDLASEGIAVTTVAPWVMRTGGPVNGTFKGSVRRKVFTAFAIADVTPGLAIDVRRAARMVVNGIGARRSLVFVGLPSRILVALFGLAPRMVSSAFAMVTRALPRSFTKVGEPGGAIARELGRAGRSVAERSRSRNNQPTIESVAQQPTTAQTPTADEVARAHEAADIAE
ncbi:MAG: SDR family NAD(P)-dependent oxidoreductase [Deltaproteobacteria bacterium]|nr:SDR family NAD(P)-dependent oxidoreductase [Nannocystaceae bacterium]